MMNLNLNDALLRRMAIRFSFPHPGNGMVLFTIRWAIPTRAALGFSSTHELTASPVDHTHLCCTLRQWLPDQGQCAIFLVSTAPAGAYMERALEGRSRTNQMLPRRHTYRRGHHGNNSPDRHHALRQASFVPVRRTRDDARFQPGDPIDLGDSRERMSDSTSAVTRLAGGPSCKTGKAVLGHKKIWERVNGGR